MNRTLLRLVLVFLALISIAVAQTQSTPAVASVPPLVKYSGVLKLSDGSPRTTSATLTFSFYAQQDATSALWQESQTVQPANDGSYSVVLGASQASGIPVDVFSSGAAKWIGVSIDGEPESSRTQLLSVPYALAAGDALTLGGHPASDYVLAASVPLFAMERYGNSNAGPDPGNDAPAAQGTPNALVKYSDSNAFTASSVTETTNGIGIGVDNATERLDVLGRLKLRAHDTAPGITFADAAGSSGAYIGQTTSDPASPFGVLHGGQWRLLVQQNGYVGIGTTTPTSPLEVVGTLKLSGSGAIIFPDNTIMSSAAGTRIVAADSSVNVGTTAGEASIRVSDQGIGTQHLADGSVTTAKTADGSITAPKLADSAVTTSKIADGSITAAKLAPGAIAFYGVAGLGANSFTDTQQIDASSITGWALRATNHATTGTAYGIRGESYSINGLGVSGYASSTTGTAVGVTGRSESVSGKGVYGNAQSSTGYTYGVHGVSLSTAGTGVRGEATATVTPVATYGVYGSTNGDNYSAGVYGIAASTSSNGITYGLYGRSSARYGIGLYAYADALNGNTYGVWSRVQSPTGIAGQFTAAGTGSTILSGSNNTARVFRVDNNGNIFTAGTLNTGGADFAETMTVTGKLEHYTPGDVLTIDPANNRHVIKSAEAYATNVIGVYSTKPGLLGTPHAMEGLAANEVPVAMVGIVPVKASAENGPIHRGDLLVTAATPGYVMRGTDRSRLTGAIVGKALQPLESGTATIQVAVTLQ